MTAFTYHSIEVPSAAPLPARQESPGYPTRRTICLFFCSWCRASAPLPSDDVVRTFFEAHAVSGMWWPVVPPWLPGDDCQAPKAMVTSKTTEPGVSGALGWCRPLANKDVLLCMECHHEFLRALDVAFQNRRPRSQGAAAEPLQG